MTEIKQQTEPQPSTRIRKTATGVSPVLALLACVAFVSASHGQEATPARTFIDYFLPMPVTEPLSKDVWGAREVGPRDPKNGLEDSTMKQWNYWDGQIIKGSDGRYHMFASRWDQAKGHMEWVNSKAIHAVSDKVTGPYIDKGLCWPDDEGGKGHNVTALVLPDGRYAIVVSDTRPGTVFVSKSLDGPWEQLGRIKSNDDVGANISIMVRPDGDYMIVPRSGRIFIGKAADGVLGPYQAMGPSIFPAVLPGVNNLEDPVVFYSGGLYHIVVNSWTARKAYHLTSKDGIGNWVNRGLAFDPTTNCTRYSDGTVNHWHKLERPGVLIENGHVAAFTLAVTDTPKEAQRGGDGHGSKVIVVPFDGAALDRDLQSAPDKAPPAAADEPVKLPPAELPPIEPLFDHPMRDVSICAGPDGTYYMTGTTGDNPAPGHDRTGWWYVNEGIRVWKSKDLQRWEPLGLVWSLERDATWGRAFKQNGNAKVRAVWAPEIHYIKGTFWLPYCMNYGGCGLLKSTSGKAEGPYAEVKKDGPLTPEIDPSLFQDDDGKVYWLFMNGKIARMNDDMTGLAEEPRLLKPSNFGHVGHEGAFLTKRNGKYHLICAEWIDGYSCMAASADNLFGPYGPRYLAIPHGGHNVFFTDKAGDWWSTIWGNDGGVSFRERPAILRIELDEQHRVRPMQVPLDPRPWWTASPPRKTSAAAMFVGAGKVELATPAEGVGIVFTLDGKDPTAQSAIYQKPIEITRDTVVKARAVWPGGVLSRVVEFPMLEARADRPLIMNPGFESGVLPWSGNSEVLVDSDLDMDNDGVHYTPHGGKKHFRLQGGREQTIALTQAVALPAGDYELSMWVMSRANADHNLGPNLTFELLDSDSRVVNPSQSSSPDCLSPKGVYVQWTRRYSGLKTGDYTVKISAGPAGADQQGKQGWVDDFRLMQTGS
jgi:hypothetical protein